MMIHKTEIADVRNRLLSLGEVTDLTAMTEFLIGSEQLRDLIQELKQELPIADLRVRSKATSGRVGFYNCYVYVNPDIKWVDVNEVRNQYRTYDGIIEDLNTVKFSVYIDHQKAISTAALYEKSIDSWRKIKHKRFYAENIVERAELWCAVTLTRLQDRLRRKKEFYATADSDINSEEE